jgi:peptidoglycan-N-acetylglucosamine deacetylase
VRIRGTTWSGWHWTRQCVADFPTLPADAIALTIDDGPTPETAVLLEALARTGIRASFFLVGELALARPDLVKAISDRGHTIGLHGWGHTRFRELTSDALRLELTWTRRALAGSSPLVRPPYGDMDERCAAVLAEQDLEPVGWTVHCEDWVETNAPAALIDEVVSDTVCGDIVLLHDRPGAALLVASVVSALKQRGFTWVPLPAEGL